jgi:rod shape-determining protein MreD
VGFVAGLLQDLIGVLPLGMTSLSFTIVGYTVGFVAPYLPPGPLRQIGVAFVATAAGESMVLMLAWLLGQGSRGVSILTVLLSSLYTAALATIVLPLMRRLLTAPGEVP